MTPSSLARFVTELRAMGLPVSPAETLMAAESLRVIPSLDRVAVHAALSASLIKCHGDRGRFDVIFDRFFGVPGLGAAQERDAVGLPVNAGGAAAGVPEESRSASPSMGSGGGAVGSESAPDDAPPRPPAERAAELGLDHRDKQAVTSESEAANATQAARAAQVRSTGPGSRNERDANAADALRQRFELERRLGIPLDGVDFDLLTLDLMSPLRTREQRRLLELVEALVERLTRSPGRRRQPTRRGELDLRRSYRRNLSHDLIPFVLPRRKRRPRRTKLLLLCDVSGSVRSVSGLMLRLCHGLTTRFERTALYAFVDRPHRLDERTLRLALPPIEELELAPTRAGRRRRWDRPSKPPGWGWAPSEITGINLHALSDYGSMFWRLSRGEPIVDRRTVVLVLGDGRSNRFDPMPWAFEAVARSASRVIWLVPEARHLWGRGDSALAAYRPWCRAMVPCTHVGDLALAVADVLRGALPRSVRL